MMLSIRKYKQLTRDDSCNVSRGDPGKQDCKEIESEVFPRWMQILLSVDVHPVNKKA